MEGLQIQMLSYQRALEIHTRAANDVSDLKTRYLSLFETLLEIEGLKVYYAFDIPSFYIYCVELLDMPTQVAKDFQVVVRKALEVPALAEAIRAKRVTISKARKICSVLNEDNHANWIGLASECSARVIEKAVAMANPREAVPESLKYVAGDVLELKIGVSEEWSKLLARTKDLLSQKHRRAVSTEEALFIVMNGYCQKNDPIEKAARSSARDQRVVLKPEIKEAGASTANNPIQLSRYRSAEFEHAVNVRDQSQCTFVDQQGRRCDSRRWLAKHHIKYFAKGGDHSPENIETLCWGHHKIVHLKEKGCADDVSARFLRRENGHDRSSSRVT